VLLGSQHLLIGGFAVLLTGNQDFLAFSVRLGVYCGSAAGLGERRSLAARWAHM
jgi:hypothetical protein